MRGAGVMFEKQHCRCLFQEDMVEDEHQMALNTKGNTELFVGVHTGGVFFVTQYVLVNLVEKLKSALDRSKCGGALLMDLSKAFDGIPHDLMIAKLKAYRISNQSLPFMCSYLHNGKQRVKVLDEKSDWLNLIKGVPQGSIMGPKIFNFFMNDFCWLFSEAILGNYADDNTLTDICESMDEVIRILGAEGRLALEWFEENQMKANPDKFQGILFVHTETETEISLVGTNIIKQIRKC